MRARTMSLAIMALVAGAAPAAAHPGLHDAAGLTAGFLHPVTGADHLLAMLAAGAFAAQCGARALWLVPLSFLGLMAVGAGLGAAGFRLGAVEATLAVSLAAFGLALAAGARWPAIAASAFVGLFALFHGHAHGAETPADANGLAYALGFLLATGLALACGARLGALLLARGGAPLRVAGAAISAVGAGLLAGLV